MTDKQKKALQIGAIVVGVVVIILLLLRQKGVTINRAGDITMAPANITEPPNAEYRFDPFVYNPDTIVLNNTIIGDGSCSCGCSTPAFVDRISMLANSYADQMQALQESTIQGYLATVPANVSQFFNQTDARRLYLSSLSAFGG